IHTDMIGIGSELPNGATAAKSPGNYKTPKSDSAPAIRKPLLTTTRCCPCGVASGRSAFGRWMQSQLRSQLGIIHESLERLVESALTAAESVPSQPTRTD